VSRSGPFNPVCKEAPHAGPSVIEGMASREGMCREPQPMMKDRHVDIIGGDGKRCCVSVGRECSRPQRSFAA
jgi:hypothetical protein